jgi:hypothetical protein
MQKGLKEKLKEKETAYAAYQMGSLKRRQELLERKRKAIDAHVQAEAEENTAFRQAGVDLGLLRKDSRGEGLEDITTELHNALTRQLGMTPEAYESFCSAYDPGIAPTLDQFLRRRIEKDRRVRAAKRRTAKTWTAYQRIAEKIQALNVRRDELSADMAAIQRRINQQRRRSADYREAVVTLRKIWQGELPEFDKAQR